MRPDIIDVTRRGSYMERYKAYVDAMRAMKEEAKERALENREEVDAYEADGE